MQRLHEALMPERKIKTALKWMSGNAAEPFGKTLCIAEVAAACDFRAAGNGIPGRVCPFDLCCRRHILHLEQIENKCKNHCLCCIKLLMKR